MVCIPQSPVAHGSHCLWMNRPSWSHCLWMSRPLWSHCLWMSRPSWSHCLWMSGPSWSHCLWMSKPSWSHCLWMSRPSWAHCLWMSRPFWSHCLWMSRLFWSYCLWMCKPSWSHCLLMRRPSWSHCLWMSRPFCGGCRLVINLPPPFSLHRHKRGRQRRGGMQDRSTRAWAHDPQAPPCFTWILLFRLLYTARVDPGIVALEASLCKRARMGGVCAFGAIHTSYGLSKPAQKFCQKEQDVWGCKEGC